MTTHRSFVPAAGHDWLLPFYDPLTRLLGAPGALRWLADQADVVPGHRVLDVGCGTGTLALMLAKDHPGLDVVGLDPDPKALARARRKASRAGVGIQLIQGFGDTIPEPSASFDRVLSSLMLHHLAAEEQRATLEEARRVLRPSGSFHILDFVGRHDRPGRHSHVLSATALVDLLTAAGFADAQLVNTEPLLFGAIGYFRGRA